MTPLLALMLAAAPQSATPPATPPLPQRFSILADPCARARSQPGTDVVVCGNTDSPRLPLPAERGPPDHAIPSNPNLSGVGALAVEGTPCAATQWGCTVGFGPPIVPAAKAIIGAVSDAMKDAKVRAARRRDAGKRVPIPLDDEPPR